MPSETGVSSCTSTTVPGSQLARAKFAFTGKNNDELSFRKHELITLTQQLDGGWWEGTLKGKTGWFPSNYVVPLADGEQFLRAKSHGVALNGDAHDGNSAAQTKPLHRALILSELIDSEKKHLAEMGRVFENWLTPLDSQQVFTSGEFSTLMSEFQRVVGEQTALLADLESNTGLPAANQRIGGVFMRVAPTLKALLQSYSGHHPRVIAQIEDSRRILDEFAKSSDADSKQFIAGLSLPFRHLDRYASALQEFERNLEEGHADRGDTQRAVSVYRDLHSCCMAVRRQQEMQLDALANAIDNWPNDLPPPQADQLIRVGAASCSVDGATASDKFLMLLRSNLVLLDITDKLNSFAFVDRLELTSEASVKRCDEPPWSMELRAAKRAAVLAFASADDAADWLQAFANVANVTTTAPPSTAVATAAASPADCSNLISPTTPQKYDTVQSNLSPSLKAHISELPHPDQARVARADVAGLNEELLMIDPDSFDADRSHQQLPRRALSFRPHPPASARAAAAASAADPRRPAVRMRAKDQLAEQEDSHILKVVEAYTATGGGSAAAHHRDATPVGNEPTSFNQPQLLVAEDEKIFVEELEGDELVMRERTLVDTVYAMKDQMNAMQLEMRSLTQSMQREQRARRRIEEVLRRGNEQPTTASHSNPALPTDV